MTNQKALKALHLFDNPANQDPPDPPTCISLRLPGDLSDRLVSFKDWGPEDCAAQGATRERSAIPRKRFVSRNSLLVALIEAGLEAVEAARLATPKTLKSRKK